jgi:acyl dehydratase
MSTTTDVGWNLDRLGEWSEPVEFGVSRERIISYAEATNDGHPAHAAGDLAPPVFAIVPAFDILMPTVNQVVPPEILMRVVHGEQDFRYHRPIEPGQTLISRAAPIGVHGTSEGVQVVACARTETASGRLAIEQYLTAFFRGVQLEVDEGEPVTEHAIAADVRGATPDASVTHAYDPDQTIRYSEASGDPMPIHLDDKLAKQMGLPGIIVHGLCTMAFCSRAVIGEFCAADPTRLSRLAVRFGGVVQPHERVTHALWRTDEGAGGAQVAFETRTGDGRTVIKDGLAEIGS